MPEESRVESLCDKEIIRAAQPFANEHRVKSWWHFWTTFGALVAVLTAAALMPWLPARIAAAVLGGLIMVRAFILYHDYMHGSILKHSPLAKVVMSTFGLLLLTPPRVWRRSHNFHHVNVGKMSCSNIGSFPIMTTAQWREASKLQRLHYRISRHPLTILAAYFTVFGYSHVIELLFKNPVKHWDSGLALLVHGGLITLLWLVGGFGVACFAFFLPFAFAASLGAYLFYAQHNFKGVRILPAHKWRFDTAALASSSYIKLGPIMRWFTGNIGYHHIHHLNLSIPFYRLPEAMQAVPELQQPIVTTLLPHDIYACLRLKLWDEVQGRMVSFREARMAYS